MLLPNPGPVLAASGLQVSQRPDGLDLDWQIAVPELVLRADGLARFTLAGCAALDEPGGPLFPACRELVALPSGSEESALRIAGAEFEEISLPAGAWIAAYQAPHLQPDGMEVATDPRPYGGDFTAGPLRLDRLGRLDGVELARLTLYPLQVRAGKLLALRHIKASLDFGSGVSEFSPDLAPSSGDDSLLAAALRGQVLNPSQVREAAPIAGLAMANSATESAGPRAAVEVDQPGLTALSYTALKTAGFPVDQVDPHSLHLGRAGVEIAIEWDGDTDAYFENGERIIFYADPRFSRYTASDVYFLTISSTPSLLVASQNADPGVLPAGQPRARALFEQNWIYSPDCNCAPLPPGRNGDRWVWDALRLPDRAAATYAFNLPDLQAGQAGSLTVWLIGYTDVPAAPDHKVQAEVNGIAAGTLTFDGKQAQSATWSLDPGVLKAGANSLKLSLPGIAGPVEGVWLDAFAVDYIRTSTAAGAQASFSGDAAGGKSYSVALTSNSGLRAYDVTSPDHPTRLTGWKLNGSTLQIGDPAGSAAAHTYGLAAESGLLAPGRVRLAAQLGNASGADELIIAPAAWIPSLAPLVSLRQGQGLRVEVEDVQAIDDWFDGRPTPEAIHAYLAWIYATWKPRPAYVLLVGDGTSDPRRYRASSSATWIPPYLAVVDPLAGETAADNRYAAVDGDDNLPDFLLGRLPVNSVAELGAVVQKLVLFEGGPGSGAWGQMVNFFADNADEAGDFPTDVEQWIASDLRFPQTPDRLFYTPGAVADAAFRQSVLGRWQAGGWVFVYHGHSSIHQWGVERFFHLDDVADLRNSSRAPLLLEMTCLTASFQVPDLPTLDESLVRQPGGGTSAVWGSTGFGFSAAHRLLASGFLDALVPGEASSIGADTLQGRLRLVSQSTQGLDALDTFTLLGDPAALLFATNYNLDHHVFLPLARR